VELTQKGVMVERLQVKASSIGRILSNLEKKYNGTYEKEDAEMRKSSSGQLGSRRAPPKIQMIPPFNANKIRNSPSTEAVVEAAAVAQEELKDIAEKVEE
jgi:predicted acylesterase/phospholipase RssA